VDVSVAERVRMGREMRNQIHGSVVGSSAPVWGSVVVVGLEDTSIILPKITSIERGEERKREGKGAHKSTS
jgi:hypothetical protein